MGQPETMSRPFISLSMIVKNEEGDLARCLASARPFVDEIVVVDTGSTDRTVEIAREHGATVHYFAWCDDFAAARNYALDRTHGEWVLHLDADEVAVVEDLDALRAELAAKSDDVLFLRVPLRNPWPDGQGYDVYGARRLFRNRPIVRWRRPIHEAVYCVHGDRPEMDASCASLIVDHDGYTNPRVRMARGKNTRNMRLLKKYMAESDEVINYFYLAQEYSAVNQYSTALKLIKRGIRKFSGQLRPDFEGAMHCAAMRYAMALKRPEEAIRLGVRAVRSYAYSELCYVLGSAYLTVEDLGQAERYFELALALRTRVAEYQTEAGTGSWKALVQLGWVAWMRDERELALERMRRAHAMAPGQALTNLHVGKLLLLLSRAAEAAPYLRRAAEIAPTMREAHLRLSQALLRTENVQAAYDHLDGLTRQYPSVPDYWEWLGNFLFEVGEYEACVDVLGRAIEHHRDQAAIYHRLGTTLRRLGRYQDAVNALALAASIDPTSSGIRASLVLAAQTLHISRQAGPAVAGAA